jgi:dsRNA-specific ribonuclease
MATIPEKVYLGSRGADFKKLIIGLLDRGKLKPKYIESLTDEKSMLAYGKAFTAASADTKNNYEQFEQLGDVTANKFIVWYAYQRFPQLDCPEGVKVVARLRINYGAKESFAPLAEKLGFWDYISAQEDGVERGTKYRNRYKKDLLEDTFEAFIGCTEYLLDKKFRPGVGYGIVYDILSDIFNELNMSLKFEDLFDAKTRLKETFDAYPQLGEWVFIDSREDTGEEGFSLANATVYQVPPNMDKHPIRRITGPNKRDYNEFPHNGWILLGKGTASKKGDAQQKAAAQGIETLKNMGYYRDPPADYRSFCQF